MRNEPNEIPPAASPAALRRRRWRWLRRAIVALVAIPLLLTIAFHAAVAWWPYPSDVDRMPSDATFLCDASGNPLAEFAAPDGQWRLTLSADEISPHLLDAIVAVEDARFLDHAGVDWRSAAAALWQDATSLRFRRGASTLTMQLQRLRQPTPHTVLGKLTQAVRAAQIERRQSKRQTLVEYLNRAPFGGNVVGAGAASWRYFDRPCRELSLAQAALLAGLPKNPNGDRPDRFPDRAKARRDFVLGRMLSLGRITSAEHALALAEPIEVRPRSLTQHDHAIKTAAPTLVRLAQDTAGGRVRTTFDLPAQQAAAAAARAHLDRLGDRVDEAAVVVIDVATGDRLAAVSLSRSSARDVDLTARPRSTGSVIKPFIYAAAFDAGASSPADVLEDSPAAWPDGYAPSNYDLQFRGRITAAAALAESRNIPALRLLSQVGVARVVNVCAALGLDTLGRTPKRFGLSLAVGGAEATACEIAQAYAALARGGAAAARSIGAGDMIVVAASASRARGPSLSPRACDETLACLSEPARTAAVCPEVAALRPAWKTGTSSGHRDAWCAAVGPSRVVVVWLGNATGAGSRSLIGADAAAPLALSILAAVDTAAPTVPRVAPTARLAVAAVHPRADGVTIHSPADRSQILFDADVPAARQRVLLKATAPDADTLHWFVDGTPLGTSRTGEPLWWDLTPGDHELRAVTDTGSAARIKVRVTSTAARQ